MLRMGPSRIALPLLLSGAVLLLYLPLAGFPFVQDDWTLLHEFIFHPSADVLAGMLSPVGKFFYRPAGSFYCWVVYKIFGLNPAGFHIGAVLLLGASAFVLVRVARSLSGSDVVAWTSGFLFVAASNILIDPEMWMAGAFDLGAVLCSLLCLDAFVAKRHLLSAFWFACALGFKESAAMLLPVLGAWAVIPPEEAAPGEPAPRRRLGSLTWHAAAVVALAALKIPGTSLFSLPATHPYAARLVGSHLFRNAELFAVWSLQAILPLKWASFSSNGGLLLLLIATMALMLLLLALVRRAARTGTDIAMPLRRGLILAAWFFLMLYPSLTLLGHFSRYYLTTALPPLAIGAALLAGSALRSAGAARASLVGGCALLATACTIDAGVSLHRRIMLGSMDGIHASNRDGDNHFIRKATIVRHAWKPLMRLLPSVPHGTLLVMEGVETGCFADKYGVQVWYRDSTLEVTGTPPAGPDSLGMMHATVAVADPWNAPTAPPVIAVAASRVVHVRATEAGMELVPP